MQKNKNFITFGIVAVVVLMLIVARPSWLTDFLKKIAGLPQQALVIGPINPTAYWYLDGNTTPAVGSSNYPGSGTGTFLTNGCQVGGCRSQVNNLDDVAGFPTTVSVGTQNEFSTEFWMQTGPRFNTTTLFDSTGDTFYAKFNIPDSQGIYVPKFVFHTPGNDLYVSVPHTSIFGTDNNGLSGINQANLSTYTNGWHHYAFTYSSSAGKKRIYLDGVKIAEASVSGSVNIGNFAFGDSGNVSGQWWHLNGMYDEAAIYSGNSLPAELVYEHFMNGTTGSTATGSGCPAGGGNHYCYSTNYTTSNIPAAAATTAAIDSQEYDPNYPAAYGTFVSPLWQLKTFENPRYKTTNILKPAMVWADLFYFAGYKQPGIDDNSGLPANVTPIADELAKTFRYAIPFAAFNSNTENALYALALQHPEYKTSYTTRHAGVGPLIWTSTMNPYMYFRTGSGSTGNRMNYEGAEGNYYSWRPISANINEHDHDGQTQQSQLLSSSAFSTVYNGQSFKTANRSYDVSNENGEIIFQIANAAALKDPDVVAEKNSGANAALTMYQYLGKQYAQFYNRYFDLYMETGNTASLFNNTLRTMYYVGGGGFDHAAFYNWEYARDIASSVSGNHYSNTDMYVRSPDLWRTWSGPSHGLGYMEMSKMIETGMTVPETLPGSTCATCNDQFSMPTVSPGWANSATDYTYQEKSVLPGQWLGLMKIVAVQGAEAIIPGYFNVGLPANSPGMNGNSYAWQYAIPSYAQATMSLVDTLYKSSHVMSAQNSPNSEFMPMQYTSVDKDGNNSLDFATGDPQTIVTARKDNSGNRYIIGTAVERNNNMTSPANEKSRNVSFKLDGTTYKIGSRLQGSTYLFDNTNTSSPVFYQLDKWHDWKHPLYWSDDVALEAEVVNDTGTPVPHTERNGAAITNGDFTTYDTYVNPAASSLTYKFQTRAATPSTNTLSFWFRARANGTPATATVKVDNGTPITLSITNTDYAWCSKNSAGGTITFPGITDNADHTLTFTGTSANFFADQFLLTKNANANLGNCQGAGGSLSAPVLSSSNIAQTTANLSWTASGGAVAGYKIYNNGTTLLATTTGTGTTYGLTGLTVNTTYNITVKAYDAAQTLGPVSNTVTFTTTSNPDTQNPTVTITTPVNGGGTYLSPGAAPNLTTMTGAAADNVGVTSVTWTNSLGGSGTATTSGGMTASWSIPTIALTSGSNVITVIAHDAAGLSSAPISITVTRDTVPPAVSITSPTNGTNFPVGTTTITLVANATDNVAIDHVDFAYNGNNAIGAGTPSGSTYTKVWTIPSISGAVTLKATAYDTSGNPTVSSIININIASAPLPDVTPPTVSMTAPIGGTVSGTVTLAATATDPGTPTTGVTHVDFYLDGVLIPGQIDTSPTGTTYNGVWDTTTSTNGTHTLTAKAYDGATPTPNITTSSSITVTVSNQSLSDLVIVNPSADISWLPASPVAGGQVRFSATIKNQGAGATVAYNPNNPSDVFIRVVWKVDGVTVACEDGYVYPIAPGGSVTVYSGLSTGVTNYWCNGGTMPSLWLASGTTHTVTAQIDDVNIVAESNEANNTSAPKSMTVAPTGAYVNWISPNNYQVVNYNIPQTLTVNATPGITKIKYLRTNSLGELKTIGNSTAAPTFPYTWTPAAQTQLTMTVTAQAFNGNTLVATSAPITILRNMPALHP